MLLGVVAEVSIIEELKGGAVLGKNGYAGDQGKPRGSPRKLMQDSTNGHAGICQMTLRCHLRGVHAT